MTGAFLHGIILAFGLILPLGAQNVFVFNQGASQKKIAGAFPVIATAALCDTLLIMLAVFGVSMAVLAFEWLKILLFSIGFVFLLYMGYSVWKSEPGGTKENAHPLSPRKQVAFAASVSLFNPHAILDTVGVIGTNSLAYASGEKTLFLAGCIAVSWIWFFSLAMAGKWTGKLDQDGKILRIINKLSAIIIWGVAVYIGSQLYLMFL